LCLAVSPWLPLVPPLVAPADTNGDAVVDVLDFQRAVAAALAGDVSLEADVNADGVVDVLDVQMILAQATQSTEPGPTGADDTPDTAVVPMPVLLLAVHTGHGGTIDSAASAAREGQVPPRAELPSPVLRLMLGALSPNAPPAHA